MKKLVIAAVMMTLGVVVQAAQVNWSMTTITDSPDAAKAAGWVAYIMDASTYDAFSALDNDKVASYAAANAAYTTATTAGRGGAVTVSYKGGNYAGSDTVSSYLVLFNNASASSATYYAYTSTQSITIAEGGQDGTMSFGTFASATASTGGWTTTAVPEPTSGLLMLLGMAGLALRRRRV